jgi:hypothetical protein
LAFTQETVVGVWLEEFFWTVEIETEWQENFDVGFLLQQCWVDWHGVLELIHADCIVTLNIALGIQWIHYLFMIIDLVLYMRKKLLFVHEDIIDFVHNIYDRKEAESEIFCFLKGEEKEKKRK